MAVRMKSVRFAVEAFAHQQVDLPQVDMSEVDGDLLRIGGLRHAAGPGLQPALRLARAGLGAWLRCASGDS